MSTTTTIKSVVKHLPAIIAVLLVVVNALIDSNTITLSAHVLDLINGILAGTGLGLLHVRTK